jgi:hypothetical protein
MKLEKIALKIGINNPKKLSGLALYDNVRQTFFNRFYKIENKAFQSPSVSPTSHRQRTKFQLETEHSVYQRSDYTPLKLENDFNLMFPKMGNINPKTIFFGSGMAAISSVAYYLHGPKKINKLLLGENAYFETKWLLEDYNRTVLTNEYLLDISSKADVYWFEYPINCTNPKSYPFDEQLNLKIFFKKLLNITRSTSSPIYLVIDYTLYFLPFDISKYIEKIPQNLTIFLITSLQKHRGLGLDLTNAGAITIYSHKIEEDYKYLLRIRAIMGASITQETAWLMPPINTEIINQIIVDSGLEARRIFDTVNRPELPIKFHWSNNQDFKTSFIFVEIDSKLMKHSTSVPYYSDLLIAEFIADAKRCKVVLIQGTSFGFPFCRIFKNSERYANTSTLRLAVGYDTDFNKNIDVVLKNGVDSFLKKYS